MLVCSFFVICAQGKKIQFVFCFFFVFFSIKIYEETSPVHWFNKQQTCTFFCPCFKKPFGKSRWRSARATREHFIAVRLLINLFFFVCVIVVAFKSPFSCLSLLFCRTYWCQSHYFSSQKLDLSNFWWCFWWHQPMFYRWLRQKWKAEKQTFFSWWKKKR